MFIEELVRGNDPMQLSKDDRVLCTLVQLSPHCSRRGSTAAAVVPIRRSWVRVHFELGEKGQVIWWNLRMRTAENVVVGEPLRVRWTENAEAVHRVATVENVVNDAFEIVPVYTDKKWIVSVVYCT